MTLQMWDVTKSYTEMLCNDREYTCVLLNDSTHVGCCVMTVHTSVLLNTSRDFFFLRDFFFFQRVFFFREPLYSNGFYPY